MHLHLRGNNKSRRILKVKTLRRILVRIQEQFRDFSQAFIKLNMSTLHTSFLIIFIFLLNTSLEIDVKQVGIRTYCSSLV